jgi:hypothetical protein
MPTATTQPARRYAGNSRGFPAPTTFKRCVEWNEFASAALGAWLGAASYDAHHCFRQRLPPLHFPSLFETLAEALAFPAERFAFCAVGFGFDERQLEEMAAAADLRFAAVGTHLQRAVSWRNRSDAMILAIARGEQDGGSSLKEFENASSSELAKLLLAWMADGESEFTRGAPQTHALLLQLLATNPPREIVLSLEGVARFAAAWTTARTSTCERTRENAPLTALAELDVAWDGKLFSSDPNSLESLRDQLIRAFGETQDVLSLDDRELARLQRRIGAAPDADRLNFERLLDGIRAAQRGATPDCLRAVRLDHFRLLI